MVGWFFQAAKQGRRDGNMFPDFGHKCPSVPGMTSSVFIFLSLQLTQMLRLETPALLASSGTACDGPRDKTGYSTWNCFSFQQTFCPFAFQEVKTHEEKPGRALPPSGDTSRDVSSAGTLLFHSCTSLERGESLSDRRVNRTKGKLGFGLLY